MSDSADLFAHYWKLLAPFGVPQPEREVEFWGNKPRTTRAQPWAFDFCWNAQHLVVEIDGGQYMPGGGRHNRDSDRRKLNDAAVFGFRVMRFSKQQLEADPQGCIDTVLRALD